jgi:hypothetical protein
VAFCARPALAQANHPPAQAATLQSPEARDTRSSAYSLPEGLWRFDIGALGISGSEAFAKLGVSYGLGAGFQLDVNLAHVGIGLMNVAGRFEIVETPRFALGTSVGVWYGNGEWFWIATGVAKELIRKLDVVNVPVAVTASAPVASWLQFDLAAQYTHAEVFGSFSNTDSVYFDAKFGMRQVEARPSARWFITDATELDVIASLPIYTAIPYSRDELRGDGRVEDFETLPFSKAWSLEAGLRSRFAKGLFGTIRLHFGPLTREIYDASVYPSFEVEFRL